MSFQDFKGDAAVFKYTVSKSGVAEDIAGWKILAEIGDSSGTEIKKATSNVVGGSDSDILITDAANGKFSVFLDTDETVNFRDLGYIETAALVGSNKNTLSFKEISFNTPKITWLVP